MKDLDLSHFWCPTWNRTPGHGLCGDVNMCGAIGGLPKPTSQLPCLPKEICGHLQTTVLVFYGQMYAQIRDFQNPSEIFFPNVIDLLQ